MGKQHPRLAAVTAAIGIAVLYRAHVRPWMYHWGARQDEIDAPLPGDELVGSGVPRTTRAVTIDAPRPDIWPWLAQIGEDHAGFYSYSLLERAVGADMHNAKFVHPEWQHLHVGDTVWLARRYGPDARRSSPRWRPRHIWCWSRRSTTNDCGVTKRPPAAGRSHFTERVVGPACWCAAVEDLSVTPGSTSRIS